VLYKDSFSFLARQLLCIASKGPLNLKNLKHFRQLFQTKLAYVTS